MGEIVSPVVGLALATERPAAQEEVGLSPRSCAVFIGARKTIVDPYGAILVTVSSMIDRSPGTPARRLADLVVPAHLTRYVTWMAYAHIVVDRSEQEQWLAALPERAQAVWRQWDLVNPTPFGTGTAAAVYVAESPRHGAVVCKMTVTAAEARSEAAALAHWGPRVGPEVYALSEEHGAYLMELLPGEVLKERPLLGAAEGKQVGGLIARMHEREFTGTTFGSLAQRADKLLGDAVELAGTLANPPVTVHRLRQLRDAVPELAGADENRTVGHLDLDPNNIVYTGDRGVRALDPAPAAGGKAFDVAQWAFRCNLGAEAREMVELTARSAGADRELTQAWLEPIAAALVTVQAARKEHLDVDWLPTPQGLQLAGSHLRQWTPPVAIGAKPPAAGAPGASRHRPKGTTSAR